MMFLEMPAFCKGKKFSHAHQLHYENQHKSSHFCLKQQNWSVVVCVCVRERERERDSVSVSVCVCVCA